MTKPEAMESYGLKSKTQIDTWCRLYREGGPDALLPKPKGRPKKAEPVFSSREEELEARVRELELELENPKTNQRLSGRNRAEAADSLRHVYPLMLVLDKLGLPEEHLLPLRRREESQGRQMGRCAPASARGVLPRPQRNGIPPGRHGPQSRAGTFHQRQDRAQADARGRPSLSHTTQAIRLLSGRAGQGRQERPEPRLHGKGSDGKLVTDVTEFKVAGGKAYLSPVMDLYNNDSWRGRYRGAPTWPRRWRCSTGSNRSFKAPPSCIPTKDGRTSSPAFRGVLRGWARAEHVEEGDVLGQRLHGQGFRHTKD